MHLLALFSRGVMLYSTELRYAAVMEDKQGVCKYIVTCLAEGRRYYATLLSLLGNRVRMVHGYAHHSGIVALHGNKQLEDECFHCCRHGVEKGRQYTELVLVHRPSDLVFASRPPESE
jgi:hypothetical protein